MGRIKVQASQSQLEWKPLPRGTYNFSIDEVVEGTSTNQHPQLQLKMSVIDGEYAGKKATHFMTISEKSGGFIREMILATGIDYEQEEGEINPEDGKPFLIFDFDSDDLIGKSVTCDAVVSEYNGKENNRFSKFRAFGETEAAEEEAEPAPAPKTAAKPAAGKPAAGKPAAGKPAPTAGNTQRRARV